MAAGLGFKTFNTGDVLSAADVNGYLMQGVLVFADATARDAAITSPQEGQFAYTKNNDSLWYYSGSAWVASGATGDIEGVTAGTGISGGGTSGTVTITNSMATAIDAKGDLVVGTGADTFSRLAVGTNGYTLVADSAETTGLKWAAPASGGGYTLINTGGTALSGTSITISTIPNTYKFLYLVLVDAYAGTADNIEMRLNGDSATNYRYTAIQNSNTTLSGYQGDPQDNLKVSNYLGTSTDDNKKTFGVATITNYTATTGAAVFSDFWAYNAASSLTIASTLTGVYNNATAITSLTLRTGNGNTFSGGTAYLYGVS